MITVFTPTFNRAYTLPQLYASLTRQTDPDFEWVVVDDGSTDATQELIASFDAEQKITIRYLKCKNGGKHRAINQGVQVAEGELFFIVDSDDYLADNAIEIIKIQWTKVRDHDYLSGICFRCLNYKTGQVIGEPFPAEVFESDHIEIAHRYGVFGDKAEVFRTEVLRQFPFPDIPGENFVPEALVWCRMAQQYKIQFIDRGIYYCDYLPDGLSRKFSVNLLKNASGFRLFYKEQMHYRGVPLLAKLKAAIRGMQCTLYILQRRVSMN